MPKPSKITPFNMKTVGQADEIILTPLPEHKELEITFGNDHGRKAWLNEGETFILIVNLLKDAQLIWGSKFLDRVDYQIDIMEGQ